MPPPFNLRLRNVLAAYAVLSLSAGFPTAAQAYRPFDGTDAAVAEAGTFELEAGVGRLRDANGKTLTAPAIVGNWGISGDSEVVLEGHFDRELGETIDGHRTRFDGTALSFKHLFRRGSLQDAEGISVATECGVLLPEWHGSSRTGATCAGIASNKWDSLAVHLNLGLAYTREHAVARDFSVIAEGPEKWPVRPVTELLAERENGGAWSDSALVGLIYQQSETLAFDVGVRHAHGSEGKVNELRLGLTWSYGAEH